MWLCAYCVLFVLVARLNSIGDEQERKPARAYKLLLKLRDSFIIIELKQSCCLQLLMAKFFFA